MILLYITYILVNVIDVFLLRYTMRTIDAKLYALMDEPYTEEIEFQLQALEKKQDKYKVDGRVEIYERRSRMRALSRMQYTTKRTVCRARVSVNMRKTKYELYDSEAPQNRGLFKMFFMGLRPIKCRRWRKAFLLERTYLLIQAPAVLLCHIIIPVVDCELNKHGWNKLLNCIQVMVNPAVTIVVLQAILLSRGPELWYVQLSYTYISGLYSLVITTPIAFFFLYTTRTDVPPQFHWIFIVLSLTGSMTIIFLCATEINTAMEVIGQIIKVKSDFMGATVQACTANLEALIANTAMARDGYPKMAYASCIGGPLFSVIVCISVLMLIRNFINVKADKYLLMGMYGQMGYIFLLIALFSTLVWSTTLGFFARRSVGLFSIALYFIYLVFALLIHSEVIHSFNEDKPVKAAIGDI